MTYDDLTNMIKNLGAGVAMPGEQSVGLPVFLIEPTGMSLVDGYDVLYHDCDVSVRVPLGSGDPGQIDAALELTNILVGAVLGTEVLVDSDMPISTTEAASPPTINVTVKMVFPGTPLLRPLRTAIAEPQPSGSKLLLEPTGLR